MNQLLKEYEFCRIKLEQVCESVYDMMMCAGAAAEISPYAMKLNLLSNYTDNYQEENVYKQDIGGEEYNQSEFRGLILL